MIPEYYIFIAIIIFCIGMIGMISRKNLFVVYMSVELMLNSVNLILATFSRTNNSSDGGLIALLMIAVIAAEAAVFLAVIITLYKSSRTINSDKYDSLQQGEV